MLNSGCKRLRILFVRYNKHTSTILKDKQITYNVTLRSVRATIVTVDKQ